MCEFSRYHRYEYLSGDTKKEHPFVKAPYKVNFTDGSYGVTLCALTMEREVCTLECKKTCSRYRKYYNHYWC